MKIRISYLTWWFSIVSHVRFIWELFFETSRVLVGQSNKHVSKLCPLTLFLSWISMFFFPVGNSMICRGGSTDTKIYRGNTRWAPTSYRWGYIPYKWPCKSVTDVVTLLVEVITPFFTGFPGPTFRFSKSIFFSNSALVPDVFFDGNASDTVYIIWINVSPFFGEVFEL